MEKVINDTECLFKSREKEYQETIDQIEVRHVSNLLRSFLRVPFSAAAELLSPKVNGPTWQQPVSHDQPFQECVCVCV